MTPSYSVYRAKVKPTIKQANSAVIRIIWQVIYEKLGITQEQIKLKTRKREICEARHITRYMMKQFTNYSLKRIGNHTAGADHSTVIHSIQRYNDLHETDKDFKRDADTIRNRIETLINAEF